LWAARLQDLLTAAKVAAGGRDVRVLDAKSGLDPAPRSLIVTITFPENVRMRFLVS